jgi:hypothetical protein
MSTHTSAYLAEWKPSGSWVDFTANVLEVSGDFSTTGRSSGFAFGDSSDAQAQITVDPLRSGDLRAQNWSYTPVRVQFTVDAQVARGVHGVILDWEDDGDKAVFTVVGFKQLISTVRVYSPLFAWRPIATKTTASSIEDPTDGDYAAGPLNWLLWQAGGRPYEQAGTYTTATFYYSLSQAPIAPRYSWIAGEDGWEEALRLVRAAGGQLYQRPDGVVAYVSPLSIAGGSSLFTLTQGDYAEISRQGSARDVVASYTTTYVPRVLVGMQEIVSDTEARVVAVGQTITVELEPQYPIPTDGSGLETVNMAGVQLLPDAISATRDDGTAIAQGTGYDHTLDVRAQRITITIENVGSLPFVIERITLRGTPIVPGEAGTVTVGSGTPTLSIEQNPYIQSRSHAQRLARMALDFYDEPRPVISARSILYDPVNHQVGHAGTLTQSAWGLSAAPVVILGVSHQETGAKVDLELVETTGVPKLSDYWLVSTSAQSGTKKIGY